MATTEKVVNQWRATILTDATVKETLQERAAEAAVVQEVKTHKRAAQQTVAQIKASGLKVVRCDGRGVTECTEVLSDVQWSSSSWWKCPKKGCKKTFCGKCSVLLNGAHISSHAK